MCTLCGSAEHTRSHCPWKDKLEQLFGRPETLAEALDQVARAATSLDFAAARLDRAMARAAAIAVITRIQKQGQGA